MSAGSLPLDVGGYERGDERRHSYGLTLLFFAVGATMQVALHASITPLLFALLIAAPVLLFLTARWTFASQEVSIFLRSFSVGLFAAGVASFYAIVFYDPFQIASDAWSFYELSSQAGPARSLQDLRTITEGAGAVRLWSWFYDLADLLGFRREQYIGITMNVLMVGLASVICARSMKAIYGEDEYRFRRLLLFITISGNLWLFAGVHLRDSVIFLTIVLLAHFWIRYLAQLDSRKLFPAVAATGIMMPTLQILRAEFFYIPLLIGAAALLSLNFSKGRGDRRFIMLLSIGFGAILMLVALLAFGEEIQTMLLTGQDQYSTASLEQSRSGSLGTALIVNQPIYIRLLLGVPYLFYFPIPVWNGLTDESALQLFKSINAFSFYFISAFVFVSVARISMSRQLRSPAFVFIAITPFALTAVVALTSLETRHLAAFMSFFFLLGLLPDTREQAQARLVRLALLVVIAGTSMVHGAWLALRYV